ncbi:MAG: hypothetical protein DRG87_08345 [Deltaproteobacteria bacterium]|nr:hypothetical protein [Deltaproteobacteria bacterium]MBW2078789.1 hypothetical protein [Deltaproteobacteria bacterium]MBW2311535.1 hypothetical protein [Deltaproteobacteria bacterium]RLB28898.1 MAG: hypothetical protein DRG87_08345 [Deltaproteobacteria bacterium]
MRLSAIFALLLFGVLISNVSAGGIGEVELIDGSVIRGEIISSEGGIYALKSDTLGTIRIEASKIRTIRFKHQLERHGKKRDAVPDSPEAQVQVLQQLIMGDQEILHMILSLLNDPDIQGIVEDPSIIEAVNRGDIEALSSNPKFMRLLDNPAIQEIISKMAE